MVQYNHDGTTGKNAVFDCIYLSLIYLTLFVITYFYRLEWDTKSDYNIALQLFLKKVIHEIKLLMVK